MTITPARKSPGCPAPAVSRGALHRTNRVRAAQREVCGLDTALQRADTYRHHAGIARAVTQAQAAQLQKRK